ncbi:ISL3 family transposase [Nonomuraea angiospora]|uniref:ISL3 family transposase n=1 Tax=Nonomuraea angiospora TaxID=46172 RepID=UPI00342DD526
MEVIVLRELTDGEANLLQVLFPHLAGLTLSEVEDLGESVKIIARTGPGPRECRGCDRPAARVHDRYRRRLRDLSCAGRPVQVELEVRRFICDNPECSVATFAEQVDGLTARQQRRTTGLRSLLERVALALAGRAGARLAGAIGAVVAQSTLIRLVRAMPDPEIGSVKVLGVDDWAKRRGHSYASVLVDMDDHRVIDILPDREAGTLADWLRAHPGVEVICRDRSGSYAFGAREGAPDAQQVADRWHMWDDLGECVQKTVAAHHRCVKDHYAALQQALAAAAPDPEHAAEQETADHIENRARVLRTRQLYQQVQDLKADGKTVTAIQRELRLAKGTARRYFHAASVEEVTAGLLAGWPSKLDDYKPYLHQRWNDGCTNITQLHREITEQGFRGGYTTVYAYLAPFKGKTAPPATPAPPKIRHISSWIRRRPDNLDPDEQVKLKEVRAACPDLDALRSHVEEFAKILTGRHGDRLDGWIAAIRAKDLPHLHTFANGLERDHAAVVAGLTLPYSSGAVEGKVCKIKFLKRLMFGRANYDLLRKMALLN